MIGTWPTAPTLGQIVVGSYDICASCDGCRLLVKLDAQALAAGWGKRTQVDQLRLRCRKCGELGVAYVWAQGNMTVGRTQLWPHKGAADDGER
jgi:hypothetical protein